MAAHLFTGRRLPQLLVTALVLAGPCPWAMTYSSTAEMVGVVRGRKDVERRRCHQARSAQAGHRPH
ncbi:MAG: hypothetical protein M0005_12975 [Actinomycetota bacterium]|nr:hypothetical protein [Actinomycetota bacterium]